MIMAGHSKTGISRLISKIFYFFLFRNCYTALARPQCQVHWSSSKMMCQNLAPFSSCCCANRVTGNTYTHKDKIQT